jgi:hypothetical protein
VCRSAGRPCSHTHRDPVLASWVRNLCLGRLRTEDAPELPLEPSVFLSIRWNLGFSGHKPRLLDENRNQFYLLQWTIHYLP